MQIDITIDLELKNTAYWKNLLSGNLIDPFYRGHMAMLIMLKKILVMRNIFQNHSEYRKETTKYNITSQNGKSQENNFTME